MYKHTQKHTHTRVSIRVNLSQYEYDTSQHESSRVQQEPTQINTSWTLVSKSLKQVCELDTSQHEPKTSLQVGQQSARV